MGFISWFINQQTYLGGPIQFDELAAGFLACLKDHLTAMTGENNPAYKIPKYKMRPPRYVCWFVNHEITPSNYSYIYHF